ncbi:MAG: flagellar protein [Lachnospiraceae bacterium]|nr:flagellar protein [Lachnospiraceae bacterium]
MNVKNCRKCKRIFNYVMGPVLCPRCREEEEEKFQSVKKYVIEHPGSTINEVSEICEVSTNQIRQWLREERLTLSDESPIGINCEHCGRMIKSGRFCGECKTSMTNMLQSAMRTAAPTVQPKKDSRDGAKMRFLDK